MTIKFADLSIQDPELEQDIHKVLVSGQFINGPFLKKFEEAWASYCGTRYCVGVASGSAALTAALKALDIKAGGLVAIPMLSFAATLFSVLEAGLVPVFVEVDSNGLMNQDILLDSGIEVDVIMPVHLYGQVLHIKDELLGCTVVEDACQAHGAFASLQGMLAAFSFYPSKNLGAAGDAGAVVTNSETFNRFIRAYINYGDYPGEKYVHSEIGTNARMDELQAAILLHKLSRLDAHNAVRRSVAMYYSENGIYSYATVRPNVWHLYPILVDKPSEFRNRMMVVDIETGRHLPYVLQDLYNGGAVLGNSDIARRIAEHVVTLPIGPHIDSYAQEKVIAAVKTIAEYDGNMWRLK